ncbi:T9SS type A sorting domain-containing protein [Tunicatimonas pelagia]|uniref:T9SS type A sorting domain-containing protein n=1 Tax=Tunicatimonas pelagia TaxID=931531 RepID=UPI0026653E22|nr:T9SS type A sorting domain-containing protein [Tunicatimonas pelagia]WKN42932.1 T9SS type A sorting domain-containing protein [Tunicatimonas pelagia]
MIQEILQPELPSARKVNRASVHTLPACKRTLRLLLLTVSVWITILPLAAQVNEEWVARYSDRDFSVDGATALAVDAAGNVYVIGSRESKRGRIQDYVTVKYNSTGEQQWVMPYNNPVARDHKATALAVDALGNVYVTGGSGSDYATIKYDTNGKQQWVRRYSSGKATALAVDAAGNVYVTGESAGRFPDRADYATIKYNTDGQQLWVARYNGFDFSRDIATALAVDATGNVYVTGISNGDYATIKYDTNGQQLWVERYDASLPDGAPALAVDEAGNVYVTGGSRGNGFNDNYATIKYNMDGQQLWVARYDSPGSNRDIATALAVDATGNVYVTGLSVGERTSYATIKYDTDGQQLWVERYISPKLVGFASDGATALAVDAASNVYVTGGSGSDYATIKYDTDGQQLWVKRYIDGDRATDLAVDATDNVYVTGGSGNSYATIKYSQVSDTEAPIITLVDDGDGDPTTNRFSLSADEQCEVSRLLLSFVDNVTDEVDGPVVPVFTVNGTAVGPDYTFPLGETTVQVTATDQADNVAQLSFIVVVVDEEAPTPDVATLPTVALALNETLATVPTSTDNCTSGTIVASTEDPLSYPAPGEYTITWQYTDEAGNVTTQIQTVNVVSPVVERLKLTSMCSDNPRQQRRWRVRNPNEEDVIYSYVVYGTQQREENLIAPSGDSFFFTTTVGGPNTTKIFWEDENGVEQSTVKASGGASCRPTVTFTTTQGECTIAREDFPNDLAEVVASAPAAYADFTFSRSTFVVGVIAGQRTNGRPGAWEIHSDCTIKPLRQGARKNFSELPNNAHSGLKYNQNWTFTVTGISADGGTIYANAINEEGFVVTGGQCKAARVPDVEPGTVVPISWQLSNRPFYGRIKGAKLGYECEVVRYNCSNGYIVGCAGSVATRTEGIGTKGSGSLSQETISLLPEEVADLQLYPNPGSQAVTLQFIGGTQWGTSTLVQLYDLTGTLVREQHIDVLRQPQYLMDVEELSSGLYMVKIIGGEIRKSLRFMKE